MKRSNETIVRETIVHNTPDIISNNNAQAAPLVGVDGNISVPTLVANPDRDNMNIDYAPVKLVVVDGICMGPTVSIQMI